MENNVIKSVSIDNLLNQRDAILERVKKAHALFQEINELADSMGFGSFSTFLDRNFALYQFTEYEGKGIPEIQKRVDAKIWQHLMDESGLKTFMDAKTKDKWNDGIYNLKVPELTKENIQATFEAIHGSRKEMFEQGVIECFKRLSWDYKTNSPCKFGKKLIVTYFLDTKYGTSVNYRVSAEIDDLIRVFHIFDGKPEPDHRNGIYTKVSDVLHKNESTLSTEYLDFKWYKNGNAHITIKNPEHIEKLNSIIADHFPHVLPPRI